MNGLISAYSTEAVIPGDTLKVLQILRPLFSQESILNTSGIMTSFLLPQVSVSYCELYSGTIKERRFLEM